MKFMEFADLIEFGSTVKELGIKQVMVISKYHSPPSQLPTFYFLVGATATKPSLDYILVYKQNVGKAMIHEEEQLAELQKKAQEAASTMKIALRKRDLDVFDGEWWFDKGGNSHGER